jgi:hypothetical protein
MESVLTSSQQPPVVKLSAVTSTTSNASDAEASNETNRATQYPCASSALMSAPRYWRRRAHLTNDLLGPTASSFASKSPA